MIEFRRHPHSPERDSDGTIVSAVDWLGNRFHIGDRVVYCIGAGRGQLMALGDVVKIKEQELYHGTSNTEIKVMVHTRATSGTWDYEERRAATWVNSINITSLNNLAEAKLS